VTRVSFGIVEKLLVWGLDIAIAVDRWRDERKQRKARGLSFKDVQHQQAQIASATRSAKTVIIPRDRAPRD
jgi:hypothetical protein